jgi:hypothetical protein
MTVEGLEDEADLAVAQPRLLHLPRRFIRVDFPAPRADLDVAAAVDLADLSQLDDRPRPLRRGLVHSFSRRRHHGRGHGRSPDGRSDDTVTTVEASTTGAAADLAVGAPAPTDREAVKSRRAPRACNGCSVAPRRCRRVE